MDEKGAAADPPETSVPAELRRRRMHFRSESLAEPFREHLDAETRIDVDSVVPLNDGTNIQYWTVDHPNPEQLLETIASLPMTRDVTLLRTIDGRHWFEVYGSAESLFTTFEEFEGITQSATYSTDGIEVVAELPADVDTDRVVESVAQTYDGIELANSYTVETLSAFRHLVSAQLTERQWTVLQLTYFSGYYERPRRRTGIELADRLGISRQAFHEHLRKAHDAVLEALFGESASSIEPDT